MQEKLCKHGKHSYVQTKSLFRETKHYETVGCITHLRGWVVLTSITFGILFIFASLVFGIRAAARYFDSRTCEGWAKETNQEVKFVDYHFFGWECLVKVEDRWLPPAKAFSVEGKGGRMDITVKEGD